AQSLVLDEEFTQAATALTAPLRPHLAPNTQVHFVVVASPDINAFVTGENIIFIHSGLVAKAKNAAALQGVLAHELAHIHGRHLMNMQDNARQSTLTAITGAVLGIGAIAAGAPQAGAALIMGGQAGAIQSFLSHTRTQEQEADRAAAAALHQAGFSAQGMVDMFNTLRTESQLSYNAPPAWLVTHPLPPERLSALQNITAQEKSGLQTNPTLINFPRLQAKVAALTSTPATILRKYTSGNPTLTSTTIAYARSIAYLNSGKLAQAQESLAPLLAQAPADPFYQEIAAAIATQQGKLDTAQQILEKILQANPNFLFIRYQYAEVLRAQSQPTQALAQYERITRTWPNWADPWQGQGLVYGQLGRLAESHLALAEAAIGSYNLPAAKQSLALAQTYLKKQPNPHAQAWAETLTQRLKTTKE
ncbi:MAG: hypothetical protein EBX37_12310, partial [Alphaproteobacteria bacterium]|nr:hypothetical protein [Alphaproteobacteria bacterium]